MVPMRVRCGHIWVPIGMPSGIGVELDAVGRHERERRRRAAAVFRNSRLDTPAIGDLLSGRTG